MPINTSSNLADDNRRRNLVMVAYGFAAFAILIVWNFIPAIRLDGLSIAIDRATAIGQKIEHLPFGLWSIGTLGLWIKNVTIVMGANFLVVMYMGLTVLSLFEVIYFSYKAFAPDIIKFMQKGAKQKA
jgi:hypothetical protein